MFNFDLLQNGLGLAFTSWDIEQFCSAIICCPVCDVIGFEINHSILIKTFFYITKTLGQKFKYLKNEKSF